MKRKLTSKELDELVIQLQTQSYPQIAKKINEISELPQSTDSIRKRYRKLKLPLKKQGSQTGAFAESQFSEDLKENGFEKDNWSHGWLKTDNSSIFIKNEKGFMTYMDIRDEIISEMKKYSPKYPVIKRTKVKGHLLVVDPADVHFGKLSAKLETGEEYSLAIAEKRFIEGIDALITKVSGFDISSVVLVLGNDILHIDTPKRTTTSGTPQDTDGMWWEAYNLAKKCYILAVEKLLTVADVHLVYCPSNHDFMSGFMLADSITSWFHKSKNVSHDISMQHRKYILYGTNLMGFTHGDGAKTKDLGALMAKEAKEAWSKAMFCYWYVHHVHHKDRVKFDTGSKKSEQLEKDLIGYTTINTGLHVDPRLTMHVEAIRTPSAPDRWHYTNGYVNLQAMECFLHSPQGGAEARFTHYF